MTKTRFKTVLAVLTTMTVAGCAGASLRFYTLDAAPPQTVVATYSGPAIQVDAVHIPAILDRVELVREIGGNEVKVSENDHWAAPLGELMRRALTQDLAARLPAGAVIFPDAPRATGADGLVIDVLAISKGGGQAVMDVSWTVIARSIGVQGRPVLSTRRRTVRLSAPSTGVGVAGNGADISALLGQLADAVTADIAKN
jgi:uncharacterized lipoprotein YmbA